MKVAGRDTTTIWCEADGRTVGIIDQTRLPHEFVTRHLTDVGAAAHAVRSMQVRGAPLIGATAAYGIALAMMGDASERGLADAAEMLLATRPTAVNLRWAIADMVALLKPLPAAGRAACAYRRAAEICAEDIGINRAIGEHGVAPIAAAWRRKGERGRVEILTHCNAGWLATVDRGTATAPIYRAQELGIPLHIWVDETRPRNQGAALTAWELREQHVPHTVIADNAGGHLMQHGRVDLCLVGTDRTTAEGDVANKIGTYLKALAAHANDIPFYVAVPSPSIDWKIGDGVREIPIEERDPREVTHIVGRLSDGTIEEVQLTPDGTAAANYAFDVTPAHLVTGLITERGICAASRAGLTSLFPEFRQVSVDEESLVRRRG
jgi:methylthioribose-1-phosphate isomerase